MGCGGLTLQIRAREQQNRKNTKKPGSPQKRESKKARIDKAKQMIAANQTLLVEIDQEDSSGSEE